MTTNPTINQTWRPSFYENQYLNADDLNEIVTYERVQQERHLLGAHTWGIAMGLQLKAQTNALGLVEMYIQPGYGWDGYGRPIVLLAPYKLAPTLFASIVSDGSSTGQQVPVWLRYASSETQAPRPGFAVCEPKDQNSRIQESCQVEIGDRSQAEQQDGVLLAGRTVDAQRALQRFDPTDDLVYDASIPFQTFLDDADQKRWLLPLGVVRWQPNADPSLAGNFLPLIDADTARSKALRRAIGVVAGEVDGVSGRIRMRDRSLPYSTVPSGDLVWVEGNLRVEGDIKLFAGRLSFLDSLGKDNGTPLTIQRVEDNTRGGKDLLATIGIASTGLNCFAVGTNGSGGLQELMIVRDDGKVGIGTTAPAEALDVRGNIKLNWDGSLSAIGGAENLRLIRGTVTLTASSPTVNGPGFSAKRNSFGDYTIQLTDNSTTTLSCTVIEVNGWAFITSIGTQHVGVRTIDLSGAPVDGIFSFIIVGSR